MSPRRPDLRPGARPEAAPPGLGAPHHEATVILEELPNPEGLLLWRIVQDVTLWTFTPAELRGELFRKREDPDPLAELNIPALAAAVEQIRGEIRLPGEGSSGIIAEAFLQCATWAQENHHLGTAMLFAQIAADAVPENAAYAHRVGMIARLKGDYHRAEAWYRRAIVLGRRGDRYSYSRSLTGLGLLYRQRGNMPAAEQVLVRALRTVRAYRVKKLEGEVLHNLCVVAFEQHKTDAGVAYAQQAFATWGPDHAKIPLLANDLAWYWMDQEGAFARALPIFQQVLRYTGVPVERLYVLANIARSAGGAGQRQVFERTWDEFWALLAMIPAKEGTASALVDVAHGALSLGLQESALLAAGHARMLAERCHETKIQFVAEAILASVKAEAPGTSLRLEPTDSLHDRFALELVAALGGGTAGGGEQAGV